MATVHAIYEHGVFKPLQPVDLPEKSEVVFEPRPVSLPPIAPSGLDAIYAALSERFDTGEPDLAARHNEHQP